MAGWNSAGVLASAIGGVVLLGIFALVESRSRDALMPLRMFGNRNLATGVVVASLFMATFGTLLYFITVYFQNVHGYSALRTGLAYLPPMVGGFAGSMLGGRLATRFGVRPTLIVSLAVGAVAVVLLAISMSTDAGYLAVAPSFVLLSIPQGVIYTTVFAASATDVAPAEQGVAGAMVSTGQQIGYAMGLAVLVAVANVGVGQRPSRPRAAARGQQRAPARGICLRGRNRADPARRDQFHHSETTSRGFVLAGRQRRADKPLPQFRLGIPDTLRIYKHDRSESRRNI